MRLIAHSCIPAFMLAASTLAHAAQDWVERSNTNARPLLEIMAKYAPESAAALGVDGFDAEIFDLRPQYVPARLAGPGPASPGAVR
jgi:hypothetical protein